MLFSSTTLVCLLSVFSAFNSAYAIPLSIKNDDITPVHTLHRRANEDSAVKVANYIKTDPSVNQGSLCFYTGGTMIGGKKTPVWQHLSKFTALVGGRTLPDLVAAAGYKTQSNSWSNAVPNGDWALVSKAMAERAKGVVYVLLGEEVSPQSVWVEIEEKALKVNPRVTGIQVYTLKADGQIHKGALITTGGRASRSPTPGSTRGRGNSVGSTGSTRGRSGSRPRSLGSNVPASG